MILYFIIIFLQSCFVLQGTVVSDADHPELFFARQLISNACGTQALLSVLLNIQNEKGVKLGEVLSNFNSFTQGLDGEMKGKIDAVFRSTGTSVQGQRKNFPKKYLEFRAHFEAQGCINWIVLNFRKLLKNIIFKLKFHCL